MERWVVYSRFNEGESWIRTIFFRSGTAMVLEEPCNDGMRIQRDEGNVRSQLANPWLYSAERPRLGPAVVYKEGLLFDGNFIAAVVPGAAGGLAETAVLN